MLKFFSKKFYSTIPSLKYVSTSKRGKNLIYFSTEKEIESSQEFEYLRNENKIFLEDIKKTNSSLFYVPKESKDYPCTERLSLVKSPMKDFEKLKKVVDTVFKNFKQYDSEINLKFSPTYPLHHRRIVINSAIQALHEVKEKGKVPLPDFSKENDETKKSTNKSKEEKEEKQCVINVVEDTIIKKYKNNLNLWINLAKGQLYTKNIVNTRGSVGTPDYIEEEAKNLVNMYPDKIKMTVMKGSIIKFLFKETN